MKTQIIQLEAHDDLVSIRDKMGWGQAARIVLVWPLKQDLLSRQLDLLLLQRHSRALGAQLAIVATHPQLRYHAGQLGIPIFRTLRQAQAKKWRGGRRRHLRVQRINPPPDTQAIRKHLFDLRHAWYQSALARRAYYSVTLLVVLALAAGLLPAAQISLQPEVRQQQLLVTLSTNPSINAPTRSGEVPARLKQVVIEGRDSLAVTGRIEVPEKAAEGSVRFTNLTEKIVSLPAGTLVSSLGEAGNVQRFQTLRPVSIPAGAGQVASAPVQALNPGTAGNLPAGQLVVIEGPQGLSAAASNPSPTRGGTSRTARAPSEQDYSLLARQLGETLEQAALAEALRLLPPGSFAIPDSLRLVEVLEEESLPEPPLEGQPPWPSAALDLTLRLEFAVLVVSGDDVRLAAGLALDAALPAGYVSAGEEVTLQPLGEPEPGPDGVYRWRLQARRTIHASLDRDLAVQLARSRAPDQAVEVLSRALPLQNPPVIEVSPAWWPRLPMTAARIHLVVIQP
jgi:hypothetical protein